MASPASSAAPRPVTANGDSWDVAASADARFVAFASNASDLVPGDTNVCESQWANTRMGAPGSCSDVFLRDVGAGTTRRISVDPGGEEANGESWGPVMTPDGRFVAFRSRADNLSAGFAAACARREFPDWCHGVFLYDVEEASLHLVFVTSDNGGEGGSYALDISPDGRFVLFDADGEAEPLPGYRPGHRKATLLWDRETGAVRPAEAGDRRALMMDVVAGEVSEDGRTRVFSSQEALAPGDTRQCDDPYTGPHNCADIYLEEAESGESRRLTVAPDGGEPNGDNWDPTISGDGRYVSFFSNADNLLPELARSCQGTSARARCRMHVYLLDLESGRMRLVSRTPLGEPGGAASVSPRVTADGEHVVFVSVAPDLVAGDRAPDETGGDSNRDVFVYDRATGRLEVVSVAYRP